MYKFILLLGLVLFSFGSSVNTAQVGQVWVPGSHKATVESGTAQMITIGQHLTTIVPMIDPN